MLVVCNRIPGFSSNCLWIAVDWTILAAFGVTMALLSMTVDYGVQRLQKRSIVAMLNITKGRLKCNLFCMM